MTVISLRRFWIAAIMRFLCSKKISGASELANTSFERMKPDREAGMKLARVARESKRPLLPSGT